MNKLVSLLVFLFIYCANYGQELENDIIDSNFTHSFSLGWSNPVLFIISKTDPDLQERFGVLLDYQFNYDAKKFYRSHIKFSPFYSNSTLSLNNFLVSIHKGKEILMKNNFNLGYGIGPYFRCNIFRGQQLSGTQAFWSSDYYGFGLEYFFYLDYNLKNDFYATILMNINLGLHQNYDPTISLSNYSQEYWALKTANQQFFSLAIKKNL